MFQPPSFEDSVKLFKQWGFEVEPGPRPEEVTLILRGPGFQTTTVYDAKMLPAIAAETMSIRWQNAKLSTGSLRPVENRARPRSAAILAGTASLLRQ